MRDAEAKPDPWKFPLIFIQPGERENTAIRTVQSHWDVRWEKPASDDNGPSDSSESMCDD